METSFFTGFGHMCRFITIAIFAVLSINATLNDNTITIKKTNLPTTDLAFRGGSNTANKILLTWSADARFKYQIEKSRDGEKFIPADGRMVATEKGETTWTDSSPRTINCYRIRMTDPEGNDAYSKALVMHYYKTGEVSLVTATPDELLETIRIDLDMRENAFVTMNIIDRANNIILQRKENSKAGSNRFIVSGSNKLSAGEYYLHVVVNGSEKLNIRLLKS